MSYPKRLELPTGLPVGTVNVYLFTEPEPLLVDTGVKSLESQAALEAALAVHNLTMADLRRVIISHPHIDHCGLAGLITARSEATVHIFEAAKPWLVDYQALWQQRTAYYRHDLFEQWGLPPEISQPILDYMEEAEVAADSVPTERIVTFQANEILEMGGLTWQVLHTPGHASTLTCFYQSETRQFLSTDMLLPITPTPIVETPPSGRSERVPSLPQFLTSLDRIEQLDCKIVYPGHGEPFENSVEVIHQQRTRIGLRKEECLNWIKQGKQTLAELLLAMYPHYPPRLRFAGLWMVAGYLDLLQAESRIQFTEVKGADRTVLKVISAE